jgi:type VI secretion system secreted protein VgrG
MVQNPLKKLLLAALALVAAAIYLEATGYGAFDTRRGENILCRLDPSCRGLVEAEIANAREIFGDVLDYDRIKIFDRPSYATIPAKLVLGFEGIAETPNGNIYYQDSNRYSADMTHDPEKLSILLHEMTHAWQHQTRKRLLLSAIREYIDAGSNYKALYRYDINNDKGFSELGIEQQASIVEDYQALRSSFQAAGDRQKWREEHCPAVLRYETKLRQVLPVQPLAGCRAAD